MSEDKTNLLIGSGLKWIQVFENDSLRAYCIKSSRGTLVIEQDKVKALEISALIALSADEQQKSINAIIHYVETSRITKPMRDFESVAKAFKAEFKKKGRITFDGEQWQSQGHLKMPKEAGEMKENPLYIDDLSAFFTTDNEYNVRGMEHEEHERLKKIHPHTEWGESQFRKTQSPVMAFGLFVECCEKGVYPPVDLLLWVADNMKRFIASDGKDDLSTIFGFDKKGTGRNRNNAFDVIKDSKSDAQEILRMAALINYFDLSVPEAAQFMAQVGKYGTKENEANGSTYVKKWYGEWNQLMKNHDLVRYYLQKFVVDRNSHDEYNKLNFLDKFAPYRNKKGEPIYTLPDNVEMFLKKHGRL
ncbi:MAG: hypothetical protein PHI31_12320 [Desulfuromonadaceae bacterium]|nr:hypothetical protein [Desulfuromonadaceae bacterium]